MVKLHCMWHMKWWWLMGQCRRNFNIYLTYGRSLISTKLWFITIDATQPAKHFQLFCFLFRFPASAELCLCNTWYVSIYLFKYLFVFPDLAEPACIAPESAGESLLELVEVFPQYRQGEVSTAYTERCWRNGDLLPSQSGVRFGGEHAVTGCDCCCCWSTTVPGGCPVLSCQICSQSTPFSLMVMIDNTAEDVLGVKTGLCLHNALQSPTNILWDNCSCHR